MASTKNVNIGREINCRDMFASCSSSNGLGIIKETRINGKRRITLGCSEVCKPRNMKKCCFLCEKDCDNNGGQFRYDILTKFKIIALLSKLEVGQ